MALIDKTVVATLIKDTLSTGELTQPIFLVDLITAIRPDAADQPEYRCYVQATGSSTKTYIEDATDLVDAIDGDELGIYSVTIGGNTDVDGKENSIIVIAKNIFVEINQLVASDSIISVNYGLGLFNLAFTMGTTLATNKLGESFISRAVLLKPNPNRHLL